MEKPQITIIKKKTKKSLKKKHVNDFKIFLQTKTKTKQKGKMSPRKILKFY